MTSAALVILRVSTGDQDEASQWPDIETFTDANGLHVVHVERIHGRSAFHGKHLTQVRKAVRTWVKGAEGYGSHLLEA